MQSQVRCGAVGALLFRLTGAANLNHNARTLMVGAQTLLPIVDHASFSEDAGRQGMGECPEWQRGRTVNPLATPS